MQAALSRSWRAWLLWVAVSLAGIGIWMAVSTQTSVGHEGPDEEHATILQPQNVIELNLTLGLKDTEQISWKGEIQVSEGKVIKLDIVQASRDSTVTDASFNVKAAQQAAKGAKKKAKQQDSKEKPKQKQKKQKQKQEAAKAGVPLVPARLRATLDAPASAQVTVKTSRGDFSFSLAELMLGSDQVFLDGQASVRRQAGALPLTGKATEDDYPALAVGKDGTAWLAYLAYKPGPELIAERVLSGNFDALVGKSGEQIRLLRFDGKKWETMPPVTEEGMEFWRPTVAVDGEGRVHVAWAQKLNDDWNILTRRFTPGGEGQEGKWDEIHVVTDAKGSDFHVTATTDASGKVWLAWQGWRGDNYEIMLATMHPTAVWTEPRIISRSKRNDWSPSIAGDSKGRVFIAWDTYDKGNYDVELHQEGGGENQPATIADSARFEARPSLYCDSSDRLWIAYEEGDEQWGKDYVSEQGYQKVGLDRNPGFALYVQRTVKLKCLHQGKLMQPAADLQSAFGNGLARNKSLPRLMGDKSGGLWLLFRHHPLPGGAGEVWHSYAISYRGGDWSAPREIPSSANLLDNRPALGAMKSGVLVVHSSDHRLNTASRGQSDLYATILAEEGDAAEPQLADASPNPPAQLTDVHQNEGEMVRKLRDLRIEAGGKELRLVRGEFHRHTEYTAHRDQDGLLEDSWRYSLDAGSLDWMGNGDHDNGAGHEFMWWIIQKQCDLHHNPPHFVAAMTYERSAVYPNGHRNVMMPVKGIRPLPRGQLQGTPEEGTPDTKVLYAYLKHFGGICASHTSATDMGTDWRDNDPEAEPIVEIYQGHRHSYEHLGAPRSATAATQIGGYRPAGFIWNALEKGYKLGFQSSSDHVSTHMSYAGVFATDNTRQAIIDAFKKRHCYGATDNILLVVRSGEHLMGDIFKTAQFPKISIQAEGGKPIGKMSIVRDNKYVYTDEPNAPEVRRDYTDMDVKPGETHYYYVRVEQTDANLAWASPMWITYQP